jgi:rod shape-determining protein MreC
MDYLNALKVYSGLISLSDSIAEENARLRAKLRFATIDASYNRDTIVDSLYKTRYSFISAEVVSNTINQPDNFITINKGQKMGLEPGMGVINDNGVVGIVRKTSKNFATVSSILNSQTRISAAIKRTGAFGSLIWNGRDIRFVNLQDIPKHQQVITGDTVITSGYSSAFPRGIMIGTVTKVQFDPGSNFYDLQVRLGTDFSRLNYIYIIQDKARIEIDSLTHETKIIQ